MWTRLTNDVLDSLFGPTNKCLEQIPRTGLVISPKRGNALYGVGGSVSAFDRYGVNVQNVQLSTRYLCTNALTSVVQIDSLKRHVSCVQLKARVGLGGSAFQQTSRNALA